MSTEINQALQDEAIKLLIAVARAAFFAADDSCEEMINGKLYIHLDPSSYDALELALNALDELPEDLHPQLVMTGPAKAEFILLNAKEKS